MIWCLCLLTGMAGSPLDGADSSLEYPSAENRVFSAGEQLTYSVDFGPLHAGTATLSVQPGDSINGRATWTLVSTAQSSEQFSMVYKVEDRTVSILDREGLFSWGIRKIINEGSYHRDRQYRFDYTTGLAYSSRDTTALKGFTQDILSALYVVRTLPLFPGRTLKIPLFDNKKHYTMEVAVLKRESIKIGSGIHDTLLLEPRVESEGLFRNKGRIRIWLSFDRRRIPVKMSTKFFFGSIDVTLIDDGSGEPDAGSDH